MLRLLCGAPNRAWKRRFCPSANAPCCCCPMPAPAPPSSRTRRSSCCACWAGGDSVVWGLRPGEGDRAALPTSTPLLLMRCSRELGVHQLPAPDPESTPEESGPVLVATFLTPPLLGRAMPSCPKLPPTHPPPSSSLERPPPSWCAMLEASASWQRMSSL